MRSVVLVSLYSLVLFTPAHRQEGNGQGNGNCVPGAQPFWGYSLLLPDIIPKNAAYAPFFTRWDDYYERTYFGKQDALQREENIAEWRERFCRLAQPEEVDYIVYQVGINDLLVLRDLSFARAEPEQLPYPFINNAFAEVLAYNGCIDALDYLIYARQCEPYVTTANDGWTPARRDQEQMQRLIEEGRERFLRTSSHFLRMRYAYQIVRLAHYAGQWQQTVDLYNFLMPKIDRRRPSILYYWTLGHLAGALQRLGKTAEAAYRYALIFRYCASKRIQAFRSFYLKDEKDRQVALRLCRDDTERATLHLLWAAKNRPLSVSDLEAIYRLEPRSPHVEIVLVGMVQEIERVFLHNIFTERKRGLPPQLEKKDAAAVRLIDLQRAVRRIAREGKVPKPKLWLALSGYLALLANDRVAGFQSLERVAEQLTNEPYDKILKRQIEVWQLLAEVRKLDGEDEATDMAYFDLQKEAIFREFPALQYFAQDFIATQYAAQGHPGKAVVLAYGPDAIVYNPQMEELEDLIRLAQKDADVFLQKFMTADTSIEQTLARLLEIKGTYLLARGQPEAALAVFKQIPLAQTLYLEQFSPFKEVFGERVHRPISDSLVLNRIEIAEKIIEYDQRAKVAVAMNDAVAAWYFYLVGLAYYNMSYFGYEWEVTDFYRSGATWTRLAKGPVFPLPNTPNGNWENIDVSLALSYFERALAEARNPELAARAAFMAARCQQKQWFSQPNCPYRPGSRHVPRLPEAYRGYYERLKRYEKTKFYEQIIQECRWLPYYL